MTDTTVFTNSESSNSAQKRDAQPLRWRVAAMLILVAGFAPITAVHKIWNA